MEGLRRAEREEAGERMFSGSQPEKRQAVSATHPNGAPVLDVTRNRRETPRRPGLPHSAVAARARAQLGKAVGTVPDSPASGGQCRSGERRPQGLMLMTTAHETHLLLILSRQNEPAMEVLTTHVWWVRGLSQLCWKRRVS